MSEAAGSEWLRLVRHAAGIFVQHGECLTRIKEQLVSPRTQFPSLTLFLGQRRKNVALRYLFPDNHMGRGNPGLGLRLDSRTVFSDHPILFADCDPHLTPLTVEVGNFDGDELPFRWSSECHLWDILLARLLFPFVDVVCIFADDVGGLDAVHTALATWASLGRDASGLEHRSRILVVAETDNVSVTRDLIEESDFLFRLTEMPDIAEVFSTPHLLHLRAGGLSGMARHRELKEALLKAIDLSRRDRKEDGCLFSATHLNAFFRCALEHVCAAPAQPFDFVRCGRPPAARLQGHRAHLQAFLELTKGAEWEHQAAYIASTLLVDAYPPRAHRFSPAAVFDGLYRRACEDALAAAGAAPADCQLIEYHLAGLYDRLLLGQGPSQRIHEETLAQWEARLGGVKTQRTCLGCLAAPPQHPLPCGHALCDACTAIYGIPEPGAEYRYRVGRCILCRMTCDQPVTVLPPTAAVRALTIDGGGVRVFIPLRFLEHMQRALGDGFPVQELVDVVFGSSSGGLLALGIFHQRRSIDECTRLFAGLMSRFFVKQPSSRWPWGKVVRAFRCWWTNGWYDAAAWDELLQDGFGATERMFGAQPVSGTKVAVTTTTTRAVLLCNYRRTLAVGKDGAYYHVHQAEGEREDLLVWECARATTAVPILFPPIHLPGIGSCEDGGLKHNNPAGICVVETRSMWPSAPEPATLISLGTGRPRQPHGQRRRTWTRGFAFRLYDFIAEAMDADEGWKKLLAQLDETKRRTYHRLDVTFPDQVPLLNAVGQVQWMTDLVDGVAAGLVRSALTSLLLASLFLELAAVPTWEDGYHLCLGTIRCRARGRAFVDALGRLHPRASTYTLVGQSLGASAREDAVCPECGRYCVPVRFALRGPDTPISLSLKLDEERTELLGGFPRSLRWFLEQQGMDLTGHEWSQAPARSECKSCDLRTYRKSVLARSCLSLSLSRGFDLPNGWLDLSCFPAHIRRLGALEFMDSTTQFGELGGRVRMPFQKIVLTGASVLVLLIVHYPTRASYRAVLEKLRRACGAAIDDGRAARFMVYTLQRWKDDLIKILDQRRDGLQGPEDDFLVDAFIAVVRALSPVLVASARRTPRAARLSKCLEDLVKMSRLSTDTHSSPADSLFVSEDGESSTDELPTPYHMDMTRPMASPVNERLPDSDNGPTFPDGTSGDIFVNLDTLPSSFTLPDIDLSIIFPQGPIDGAGPHTPNYFDAEMLDLVDSFLPQPIDPDISLPSPPSILCPDARDGWPRGSNDTQADCLQANLDHFTGPFALDANSTVASALPTPGASGDWGVDSDAVQVAHRRADDPSAGLLDEVPDLVSVEGISPEDSFKYPWGCFDGSRIRALVEQLTCEEGALSAEVLDYFAGKWTALHGLPELWLGRLGQLPLLRRRVLLMADGEPEKSLIEVQTDTGLVTHYGCPSDLGQQSCRLCQRAAEQIGSVMSHEGRRVPIWKHQVWPATGRPVPDGTWLLWVSNQRVTRREPQAGPVPEGYRQTLAWEILSDVQASYGSQHLLGGGSPGSPASGLPVDLEPYWTTLAINNGLEANSLWEKVTEIAGSQNPRGPGTTGLGRASELLHLALSIASPETFIVIKRCLHQVRTQLRSPINSFTETAWGSFDALRQHAEREQLSGIGVLLGCWKLYRMSREYKDNLTLVISQGKPPSDSTQLSDIQGVIRKHLKKGRCWDNVVNDTGRANPNILCFIPQKIQIGPHRFTTTHFRDLRERERRIIGQIIWDLRPNLLLSVDAQLSMILLHMKDPGGYYPLEHFSDEEIKQKPLWSEFFVEALRAPRPTLPSPP
ncbi:hypothetical protein BDV59DRAFT_205438 [Aspergillus ambiguus]|uniref:patatin-like phospholipase family protein n=1 Tax=Aspergillus ambiguus TaxID=176160 RepID=UPI003CCE200C